MKQNTIAISGWKLSGKDTTALFLKKHFNIERLSFADKLKDMVSKDYNIDRTVLDDPIKKELPLINYPVIPKDNFSNVVLNIVFKHLKTIDNKEPNINNKLTTLYHTPRSIMILEGCIKRAVNPNYWIYNIIDEIKSNPNKQYCISDVRFQSEMEILKQCLPIFSIRIERFEESTSEDESEHSLDNYNFDLFLKNNKTLNEYEELIKNTFSKLLSK